MTDSINLLNQLINTLNKNNILHNSSATSSKGLINKDTPLNSEIRETSDEIYIIVELPGIQNREDVNFHITSTRLKINGVRQKVGSTISTDSGTKEEKFEKSFNLPYPISPESANAIYTKGILTLKLSKKKERPYNNVYLQFLK
ncbi:Hsp20/alpha crystallin family protein [Desulfotruncus alcoholivorax]|uniref:Hsp20/alpha crystallin family protein n=1 Tax=Desulfotruncus alcoholivorax TaxID=265477 RepID=UPI00041B5AD3|nr:Hsp20/alpha crystallin family protein [Desulfotruncus alcoholivorax]